MLRTGCILLSCLACCQPVLATTESSYPQEHVRVMLQGSSTQELAGLARRAGANITHELPIINAIGATISEAKLAKLIDNDAVTRHITDLSVQIEPQEEVDQAAACDVVGALEIDVKDQSVTWALFNKGAPVTLSSFSATVKSGDFTLLSTTLNGSAVGVTNKPEVSGSAVLKQGKNLLRFNFASDSDASLPLSQPLFQLSAQFANDAENCETKLIKGYAAPQTDSFFPSQVGADVLHRHNITGKGVGVAIVDSGIWQHPSLSLDTKGKPRIAAYYDAIENHNVLNRDESGHGTHIASVLASSTSSIRNGSDSGAYQGVAPDVSLVIVKAFGSDGQADYLDLVRAIQFVVDNRERYNIRVLNLSFAAHPRWHYWLDPINQAVMRAWQAGITVVAAAGNEGPDAMTVGSPGNLPYIITVGAVTDSWTPFDRDDDYIPDFSSRGPTPSAHIKPDVLAPGGHISALISPNSTLLAKHPEYQRSNGEFVLTGTSQASAVVAGIAALMIQLEPELTPNNIKCMLMSSAEPAITDTGLLAYSPFVQGDGVVSVSRAITLGERNCANQGLNIEQDIAGTHHFDGPAIIDARGNITLPGLEQLLSKKEQAKGHSTSRKWGVKEHIERDNYRSSPRSEQWEQRYHFERRIMESISGDTAPPNHDTKKNFT